MHEQSISRYRQPPVQKPLISSAPFPVLNEVFLRVWRWPSGKHVVMSVHPSCEACPPPRKATHAESPDELRLAYPSVSLPPLEWDAGFDNWRTPTTHSLHAWSSVALGKSKDWLIPETIEAVFIDPSGSGSVVDHRVSLISGPGGPAPLPKNTAWPQCRRCSRQTVFSQSVDFRDVAFAHLLPGTTLVIFFCEHCHQCGEWEHCTETVWLPSDSQVGLQVLSGDALLRQCVQYYGMDAKLWNKMQPDMLAELDRLEAGPFYPCIRLSPSYGTKVGGVPWYLNADPEIFDREGAPMEYIGQIATPEHIPAGGFGYIFYSVKTRETRIEFQDT